MFVVMSQLSLFFSRFWLRGGPAKVNILFMRHLRPRSIMALVAFLLVALAPLASRAAVVTFHQNKDFDGSAAGAVRGAGSGFALASDWTAITFLDSTSCAAVTGVNCSPNTVLLVVDSNVTGAGFAVGGIAFNYGSSPTPAISFNGSCAGCSGPDGTPAQSSNGQTLPNRAAVSAASLARTSGYDVSISWSNNSADTNQTFAGSGRTSILLNAGGLGVASFASTAANGQYAVSSIVKCSINCGAGASVAVAFDAPEPASLAVLGVGLAGLGVIRRRWRADGGGRFVR